MAFAQVFHPRTLQTPERARGVTVGGVQQQKVKKRIYHRTYNPPSRSNRIEAN